MTALPAIRQSPTEPEFVQNPYPFYDRARALGDLVWWEDYGLPVATTYRAVDALLRDRRLGREVPPGKAEPPPPHLADFLAVEAHSMLELEPPRHTRLRGLVLRAFTSRRIAGLAPEIEALCHQLIDALPRQGAFDLLPLYASRVPVIVICRLLGVPETMADQLLAWSHAMVGMYQARRDRAMEEAANAAARAFADFLRGYVAERRARPADDLITHLIAAEDEGSRLTTDELISTCILLLNAGHEATVHALGNAVKALLEEGADPAWLAPDQIEATVEEVLRFDPPLHMFLRHAYDEIDLFGHRLRPGDRVGCLLAAANRDPAAFARPHRFDPHRFDPHRTARPQLSFGAGIHFCVGAPLARLELRIGLATLFARRPGLRLVEAPRYADLYHFRGLERLMLA